MRFVVGQRKYADASLLQWNFFILIYNPFVNKICTNDFGDRSIYPRFIGPQYALCQVIFVLNRNAESIMFCSVLHGSKVFCLICYFQKLGYCLFNQEHWNTLLFMVHMQACVDGYHVVRNTHDCSLTLLIYEYSMYYTKKYIPNYIDRHYI